jgi:hypothetical protein
LGCFDLRTYTAALCNTIGGAGTARYEKHPARDWWDQLLTESIAQLSRYLDTLAPSQSLIRVHCLDVVVPTFCCNVDLLKAFTNLRVTGGHASTTIVIVADNPLSDQVAAVQVPLTHIYIYKKAAVGLLGCALIAHFHCYLRALRV